MRKFKQFIYNNLKYKMTNLQEKHPLEYLDFFQIYERQLNENCTMELKWKMKKKKKNKMVKCGSAVLQDSRVLTKFKVVKILLYITWKLCNISVSPKYTIHKIYLSLYTTVSFKINEYFKNVLIQCFYKNICEYYFVLEEIIYF